MTSRDALWLGVGALAYPVGVVLAHLLAHRSVIYPHVKG